VYKRLSLRLTYEHVTGIIRAEAQLGECPFWFKVRVRGGSGDQPEMRSFATGIRHDQQAVASGLTLPYSSGKVEGTVNKIKMLKRQMYGRATFALLRTRVILHPT
jgi:transposase